MTYHLAPHMSYGVFGTRAVLLDLVTDRYLLLGEAEAAALAALAKPESSASPALVNALLARSIIVEGAGSAIAPVDQPRPLASALETLDGGGGVSTLEASLSCIQAILSIRTMGLARTVMRSRAFRRRCERRRNGGLASDSVRAAFFARGFAEARIGVPLPRRCVPDSLALARCLWKRGMAADVFFGVQLDPLLAHAWVQIEEVVLSDPLNIAADYCPVFRL